MREQTPRPAPLSPSPGPNTRIYVVVSAQGSNRMHDILAGQVLLVGRSGDVPVHVDDPLVSRIHAQIERRGSEIWVLDRGSSNGTWVNGKPCTDEARLMPGDEVKIGSTVITVVVASALPRYVRTVLDPAGMLKRLDFEMERAQAHGVPLAIIAIRPDLADIDRDLATARLADVLGPGDLVGTWASGEVLAALPEGSRMRAEALARRFIELVSESGTVTRGIGVAVFPDDGMDPRTLVHTAISLAMRREWNRVSRTPAAAAAERDWGSITRVTGISEDPDPAASFVARDPAMRNLIKLAHKVAASPVPVFITGETGAGKEVLARWLHSVGQRSTLPFVKVNCAALPSALIEAELFGHDKGAFTGAGEARAGYFEAANGGTLVLDEITELPGSEQVKLLRFLDDYRIVRVGRRDEVQLDVRVIAMTNRDPQAEVQAGRFRQDLFYRLGTLVLLVPPLRSRLLDIPILAELFAHRAASRAGREPPVLSQQLVDELVKHSWPGNVRELRNAMEAAVIGADGDLLLPEHLPERFGRDSVPSQPSQPSQTSHPSRPSQPSPPLHPSQPPASSPSSVPPPGPGIHHSDPDCEPMPIRQRREEAEADEIRRALAAAGGNQTSAARALGISRRTLWTKIKRYGI